MKKLLNNHGIIYLSDDDAVVEEELKVKLGILKNTPSRFKGILIELDVNSSTVYHYAGISTVIAKLNTEKVTKMRVSACSLSIQLYDLPVLHHLQRLISRYDGIEAIIEQFFLSCY